VVFPVDTRQVAGRLNIDHAGWRKAPCLNNEVILRSADG